MAALHIANPTPGHYRFKRVKGGAWCAAVIYRPCPIDFETWVPVDRWYPLRCLVDGIEQVDPLTIWTRVHPIDFREYCYMIRVGAWARVNAPHHPEANPRLPIQLDQMEPLF